MGHKIQVNVHICCSCFLKREYMVPCTLNNKAKRYKYDLQSVLNSENRNAPSLWSGLCWAMTGDDCTDDKDYVMDHK